MSDMSEHRNLPAPILEQAKFRSDVWIKATLSVLCTIVPVAVLGVSQDRDPVEQDDEDGWHSDVFWQVALPAFLVWAVVNFSLSRVSTWMGFDMLAESSPTNDLKVAIRTNMTSSGIILALFLTIVVGMLQTDMGVGTYSRNDMWYRLLLVFSIEACVRGLLMVSFFILYCEPLDRMSATQFAVDNMLYLGEPVTCIMAVLSYFLFACMVWVFFTDGKYVGIIACAVFGYGLLRSMVVLGYLSSWTNPHLDGATRESR
eukprot:CAMPEP_0179374594 /NCGR_PEP_ID=MMETSP0797-20121207/87378_1 /TAXON_ID=47934 /ORGANISM="Dinophysis acuminata, Strain DAEP01" /LENGTH=257 /DNA_ID=CAMNT_0021090595 /DNA_START=17 /DNA_END=787 /DNA_ORIENTATION=+